MAETILVTGATGTLGSQVVKQLLSAKGKEDVNIKAAARSSNDNTFEGLNKVQVVQLDYNNPKTLSAALKGVDKLFLLTPFQSNMVAAAFCTGIIFTTTSAVTRAKATIVITTPINVAALAFELIVIVYVQ